jgi:lipopolysaccharide heptosyltransferase I
MMRIAIVRLTSLGDVVHTLPVAAAIRRHRPDAQIVWIVEEHEQVLLAGNPSVDRVVLGPLRRWRNWATAGRALDALRELRALTASLKSMHIDVTVDVQGWWHKTSPLVVATRAPQRIGFSRGVARDPISPLFTTTRVTPPREAKHVVDLNLSLLKPLGIDSPQAEFVFPPWPDAEARVDAWMTVRRFARGEVIALLPSTRGPKKLWPAACYVELAKRLRAATELPIVVVGGPGDEAVLASVATDAGVHVYAPTPVADIAKFLARACLVVGNDTGPLHLAAAANVPSLGLFGPTFGVRNGPYGPTGFFIQSATRSMADISVDHVLEKSLALLADPKGVVDASNRDHGRGARGRDAGHA